MPENYNPKTIEPKWDRYWEENALYHVEVQPDKPKYYVLEMLPYPSGILHMGHVRNYSIGDAVARYMRMAGYNVLHPIGWDSFGLPAENAAIRHQTHPREWTDANIAHMRAQCKRFGFSYDWAREISTAHPEYYRWNQWFFLKCFERGLAYRKKSRVNWCPECHTVLANEQVVNGCCWRHEETPVEQRELEQWFFKVTAYADELLADIDQLQDGWPERVLTMQRNWIGKSTGCQVNWKVAESEESFTTFTTRLDTLYGATFIALAPDHPLVQKLIVNIPGRAAIAGVIEKLRQQTRRATVTGEVEKEGIFTGRFAVNSLTGDRLPIWVANFVLMEYGTGAIQGVPGHDQRDFEFAKKYRLPIKIVVHPPGRTLNADLMQQAYTEPGVTVNSGPYDGLETAKSIEKMTADAVAKGIGKPITIYRIKDWGISRQRYWGTPIPVLYCDRCGTLPVPESDLPVLLPPKVQITGLGHSPLNDLPEFVNAACPQCHGAARRETDTMDTFVDSSWYFYRYTAPDCSEAMIDPKAVRYWFPIDQYIGGIEHAVLHLIYSRFFTKVMRDLGLIESDEPVKRLFSQGMVLRGGVKMSKSRGNVVDPDAMVELYGADTTRLYTLFAAPPEKDMEWSDQGIEGCYRFLQRAYRIVARYAPTLREVQVPANPGLGEITAEQRHLLRKTHQTIKRVTLDFESRWHFNTSVAAIMELVNELYLLEPKIGREVSAAALKEVMDRLVLLLAPLAPHLAEELWERLGHTGGISFVEWPKYHPDLIEEEEYPIVIQINGRLRGRIVVTGELSEEELTERALSDERIAQLINGKRILKTIVVPKKLVNIVVS